MRLRNFSKRIISSVCVGAMSLAVLLTAGPLMGTKGLDTVYAERSSEELYEPVSLAMLELQSFMDQIRLEYTFTDEDLKTLEDIYHDGTNYIANNAKFESFSITSYVSTLENRLLEFAKNYGEIDHHTATTTKYIGLYSNIDIPRIKYGETCMVVLPFVNYSDIDLYNVVVKPQQSGDPAKWPFEIERTGDSQVIPYLPGNTSRDTVYDNRMEIGWTWTALSEKVKTGYYELVFDVTYERNGQTESTTVASFVYVTGSPDTEEKKEEEPKGEVSTPRIIVTGFDTDPVDVYAGDTFTLTLHVENTSSRTEVTNILFALEAQTGTSTDNSIAAFLPTSGSSTIYKDRIKKGGTCDISIEMTARADLSQKPYVLVVNMSYEDADAKPYTSQTNVSIPIRQEAKYDVSTMTADPAYIMTGNSSNIMFNVYNTGKTTLYNVAVKFDQNEVSGGDVFLGKLESGATGKVDTEIIGQSANDGSVTVYISFEDESGNATVQEYEIQLMVDEPVYVDPSEYEGPSDIPVDIPEEEKGLPVWALILIIVGSILVVGVIVLLAVLAGVKKRKAEQALLDDGDDEEL